MQLRCQRCMRLRCWHFDEARRLKISKRGHIKGIAVSPLAVHCSCMPALIMCQWESEMAFCAVFPMMAKLCSLGQSTE